MVTWASNCRTPTGVSACSGCPTWRSTSCSPPPPSGPDSPLKAIFPVMAATISTATPPPWAECPTCARCGPTAGSTGCSTSSTRRWSSQARRASAPAGRWHCRGAKRGRDQRRYFRPLVADAVGGGDTAFDGPFWEELRPAAVPPSRIVANEVAVFLVGGWHDAFQRGAPLNYAALQNASAGRPDEHRWSPVSRPPTSCGC